MMYVSVGKRKMFIGWHACRLQEKKKRKEMGESIFISIADGAHMRWMVHTFHEYHVTHEW